MFIHIFAFRWKAAATDADQAKAATEILALRASIPEILEAFVGNNLSERGQDHTFGGVMKFNSQADYETYAAHPDHQRLLRWLGPLIDPLELDFEA